MSQRLPGVAPRAFATSSAQRDELERRASGRTVAHREVLRAGILLALSVDPSPSAAARRLGVDVKTVRRWRDCFLSEGLPGLDDRDRPGRPPRIPPEVRYETISLACAKPEDFCVLFRDVWTFESLAQRVLDRHPELGTFDLNINRAGFTAVSRTRWRVDTPLHTGRWQPTPYVGSPTNIFGALTPELAPLMGPID